MNLELKLQKLEEKHQTILKEMTDLKRQRKDELVSALSHMDLADGFSHPYWRASVGHRKRSQC